MDALVRTWILLLAFGAGSYGQTATLLRYDYEYDGLANAWLKYHAVPATWSEARMRCHAEGGTLASPTDEEMKKAIVEIVQQKTDKSFRPSIFIGVHSIFSKGDYATIEGVPLLRLDVTWQPGEPDNYEDSERCLTMSIERDGAVADSNCEDVRPYVCSINATKSWTHTECGTTDTGYKKESTGSCYKLHTEALNWSQAYMTCMAEGGYLAIVDTEAEVAVVKSIFARYPAGVIQSPVKSQFMAGVTDWAQNGQSYTTIHGQDLESVHHRWASNEPKPIQSLSKQPHSINLFRQTGNLVRMEDSKNYAFLCEKDPKSLL